MTEEREALIDKFQKWLDTKPREQIIAAVCANIAEEYAEQLLIQRVVFNEAETIDKKKQKKLIEQIMKADEGLGLYSEVELCECGGNKRVGLDCTMKPCKHPYYKK